MRRGQRPTPPSDRLQGIAHFCCAHATSPTRYVAMTGSAALWIPASAAQGSPQLILSSNVRRSKQCLALDAREGRLAPRIGLALLDETGAGLGLLEAREAPRAARARVLLDDDRLDAETRRQQAEARHEDRKRRQEEEGSAHGSGKKIVLETDGGPERDRAATATARDRPHLRRPAARPRRTARGRRSRTSPSDDTRARAETGAGRRPSRASRAAPERSCRSASRRRTRGRSGACRCSASARARVGQSPGMS